MKKQCLILLLLSSCYTKIAEPNLQLVNMINQQAALKDNVKTEIELNPAQYFFNRQNKSAWLHGSFWIKNVGDTVFNILTIQSNCTCIIVDYQSEKIFPSDSLRVQYKIELNDAVGLIRNTIVVVGNCSFGNKTFYIEGFLNKQ